MGSALVVGLVKYGLLALLWLVIIAIVRTIRVDLTGKPAKAAAPRAAAAPAAPVPAGEKRAGRSRGAGRSRSAARRLVVVEGALRGTTVTLDGTPVTLGRADDSTLVLTDDYASNRHARLTPGDGAWLLEDLGSTNGTYLGPNKVTGRIPVALGTQIRIGKTVMELRS